jgi:hypothetical protein
MVLMYFAMISSAVCEVMSRFRLVTTCFGMCKFRVVHNSFPASPSRSSALFYNSQWPTALFTASIARSFFISAYWLMEHV